MSYILVMNGTEFLKRLRRLGKAQAAFTTIKDLKKEIGSGLLNKMLTDLQLDKDDLK